MINVNSDELEHTALDALTSLARAFTDTDNQTNSQAFCNVLESIIKGDLLLKSTNQLIQNNIFI